MSGTELALRLDDVGAASKQHEVYGLTRIPLGRFWIPFPGNFLFLKRMPGIKRWGPYAELSAEQWLAILAELERFGARMTVGITAGWVESDGRVVPFPKKFPDAAAVLREATQRGLVEIANHGYTHCVLRNRLYRPQLVSGNRPYHREFHEWLPADTHREHVRRAQDILQDYLGMRVVTFVPPGNVFTQTTLVAALEVGIRYVSCLDPGRYGAVDGLTFIADGRVASVHDRDVVLGGLDSFRRLLQSRTPTPFVTVRAIGESMEGAHR